MIKELTDAIGKAEGGQMSHTNTELEKLIAERQEYVGKSVQILSKMIADDLQFMEIESVQLLYNSWEAVSVLLRAGICQKAKGK